MKTDRELLELAAKACNYQILRVYTDARCLYIDPGPNENGFHWNPLTDDGDALRLAVKLDMINERQWKAPITGAIYDECNGDWYAVTRRAIVLAAAAIGESMP